MSKQNPLQQLASKNHKLAKDMFFNMYTIKHLRHDYIYNEISDKLGYSVDHLKRIIPLSAMKKKDQEYEEKEQAKRDKLIDHQMTIK